MNRIFADISMDLNQPIPDLEQLVQAEHTAADKWKTEGTLEHLFMKNERNGVILVFKDITCIIHKHEISGDCYKYPGSGRTSECQKGYPIGQMKNPE